MMDAYLHVHADCECIYRMLHVASASLPGIKFATRDSSAADSQMERDAAAARREKRQQQQQQQQQEETLIHIQDLRPRGGERDDECDWG